MQKHVAMVAVMSVLGLAGLVACSSSDGPLSQSEFVKQGNAICDRTNAKLKGVIPDDAASVPARTLAPDFSKFADIAEKANQELKDLDAPDEDVDGLKEATDGQDTQAAKVRAIAKTLASGQAVPGSKLDEINALSDKVNPPFDKIGLNRCGSDAED